MIIEFSRRAQANLGHIHDYIAEHNPPVADAIVARLLQSIRYLELFPELGPLWRAGPTRALSIPGLPYRVHYQIDRETVQILTVVHTSRRWDQWVDF